ncbi:unnamed protein product [Urochloa decumbens]|uniref:Protein kinase domain-containing protein n=1 Tax=Urochloa decumbens TaxID=240449 RepID=A0ABC9GSH5_9POAL
MPRLQVLWLLLPTVLVLSVLPVPASAIVVLSEPAPATPPGCPSLFGDITIYYPFGLTKDCSWDESFTLSCNDSFSPARLYYRDEVEVKDITVEAGEMSVFTSVSSICFISANETVSSYRPDSGTLLDLTGSPLLVSQGKNQFTAIGCYTLALLGDRRPDTFLSGCITTCASVDQGNATVIDKGCTGIGCCQIAIPSNNLSYIRVDWSVSTNSNLTNLAWKYSPCSYALVAEKGWYSFNRHDLTGTEGMASDVRVGNRSTPATLVLDWAIDVSRDGACVSSNSEHFPVRDGRGYLCNCSQGYGGNPYLKDGCKTFFDKNGGKILKGAAGINIFTEEQLEKFTNHYNTLIGRGAFGKVFMGVTDENQRVAVKRSIIADKVLSRRDNFQLGDDTVNEITFQFGNSHPNLVRLIGCCLETNIPVLVFEFIPNGSLYILLHVATHKVLALPTRLKIAIGSAEALAYIHSHGDHGYIHGDIKSANILLDDSLVPKVSDFGSSKILSIDRYAMAVAADMSYVDPVYMKTERFVKKSDVYSFGMVLLELITRKTVKYGENRSNSLPMDFIKSCKEKGNGREMYDKDILSHDGSQCHHCIECLDKIGDLTVRCLKEDVDERPTMEQVVDELTQVALVVDKCKQKANLIAYSHSYLEIC